MPIALPPDARPVALLAREDASLQVLDGAAGTVTTYGSGDPQTFNPGNGGLYVARAGARACGR